MAQRFFINTSKEATLLASVGSADTTFNLAGVGLQNVPATPFYIRIDPETASEEVCLVTGGSATSLTVTRGYDGTSTTSHAAGATVRHVVAAEHFNKTDAHVETASNVHGIGSGNDVVGTGTTQTLTDKTINESITDVAHSTSPAAAQAHRVHADAVTGRHGYVWDNTAGDTGKAFLAKVAGVDRTYIEGDGDVVVGGTTTTAGLTNTGTLANTGAFNNTGNVDITGTVHATGAADFDSTLNADGNATFAGSVDIDGNLTVNNLPAGPEIRVTARTTDAGYNFAGVGTSGSTTFAVRGDGFITSTGKAYVLNSSSPVMVSATNTGIVPSPASGDFIYDQTSERFKLYSGGAWGEIKYPLGIWAGRTFDGTGNVGAAINSGVEVAPTNFNSPSTDVLANRRYNIRVRIKGNPTASDQYIFRLRKSTIAGTILREHYFQATAGIGELIEFTAEYSTTVAESGLVFVATCFRLAGAGSMQLTGAGAYPAQPTGVWVEDVGPTGRVTLTAV
jgi:hypothetical protein